MNTRLFRARSLDDARDAALSALGPDAVILTSREVKRQGMLGLLGATEVEVAAACPVRKGGALAASPLPFALDAYTADPPSTNSRAATEGATRTAVVNALRSDLRSELRAVKSALGNQPSRNSGNMDELAAEVIALREVVEQLLPRAPRAGQLAALLRASGIEGRAATELTRAVKSFSPEALDVRIRAQIQKMIVDGVWPVPRTGERTVIAAVGPSGVGKTTTLAKLATHAKKAGLSVAFVTCDTFRVGGVEQVERYGVLLDARVDVARTLSELQSRIEHSEADVVIVDTSGRPPTGEAPELFLRKATFEASAMASNRRREVLLCLPAASREVDVLRAGKVFSPTCPTGLIFTKLDETRVPSGMLHAAFATKLPVVAVCSGPRVPEDIAPPDTATLALAIVPATPVRTARAA